MWGQTMMRVLPRIQMYSLMRVSLVCSWGSPTWVFQKHKRQHYFFREVLFVNPWSNLIVYFCLSDCDLPGCWQFAFEMSQLWSRIQQPDRLVLLSVIWSNQFGNSRSHPWAESGRWWAHRLWEYRLPTLDCAHQISTSPFYTQWVLQKAPSLACLLLPDDRPYVVSLSHSLLCLWYPP